MQSLKATVAKHLAATRRMGSGQFTRLPLELRSYVQAFQSHNFFTWFFRVAVDHYRLLGVFHQSQPHETAPPIGTLPMASPSEEDVHIHLWNLVKLKDYVELKKTHAAFSGSYSLLEVMIREVNNHLATENMVE